MPDPLRRKHLAKIWIVALATVAITALHATTPSGPHAWHWIHLVARELYYIPILLAASWFSWRGTACTALGVSLLYLLHVLLDWRGYPMVQAEQATSVATYWLVALAGSWLFGRIRAALEEARTAHAETLTALTASLELREGYTAGHAARVRAYTLLLAVQLGGGEAGTHEQLGTAALFHDIGKIGIPDTILLKAGPLDAAEWQTMRSHPELGAKLIGRIRSLAGIRDLVISHHERFDGTGYPHGLRGEGIQLGARLLAVADSFDAMTTDRPYRPARSFDEAAQVLREGSGTQFDPRIVQAFLAIPFGTWSGTAARHGLALRHSPEPPA